MENEIKKNIILKDVLNIVLLACNLKGQKVTKKDKTYAKMYLSLKDTLERMYETSYSSSKEDIKQQVYFLFYAGLKEFKTKKYQASFKGFITSYIVLNLKQWFKEQYSCIPSGILEIPSLFKEKDYSLDDLLKKDKIRYLNPLTYYERYLFFLYCYLGRSIKSIAISTFQNRNTVRRQLKLIRERLYKELYVEEKST